MPCALDTNLCPNCLADKTVLVHCAQDGAGVLVYIAVAGPPCVAHTHAPVSGRERVSVLVADHDKWTRLNLSTMLDDAGFHVEQASNGVSAMRIAEVAQPQIVLLRHNLPELGAVDVLHMLRTDRRTRHCAVLQLQDWTIADDDLDSDGLLNLPCHPVELLATVVNALETRHAVRGSVAQSQADVGVPMRSVSASMRAWPLVATGTAQATSRMRNAGRSG